jgi:hypothetical protein
MERLAQLGQQEQVVQQLPEVQLEAQLEPAQLVPAQLVQQLHR